jgi:ABC-type dipeptide/oligopeptide/nickel transport system permease component
MLTYILRRLLIMVPTLFGVTLVSFWIMQLAPGDPLLAQLSGGSAGQSTGTHEAYVIQKRDLHLDKPLFLNFRYFKDYTAAMHWAAYFRARTTDEILAELPQLAKQPDEPTNAEKLAFLRRLGIPDFEERLSDPQQSKLLAESIEYYSTTFCEVTGLNGVPAAIGILQDPKSDLKLKIGAIRCLNSLVAAPFVYTYSVHPSEDETPAITEVWRLWWDRRQKSFPPVDAEARQYLEKKLAEMAAAAQKIDADETAAAHDKIDAAETEIFNGDYADFAPRFFAEKLLNPATPLDEKFVSSIYLRRVFSAPLRLDVATGATAEEVDEAASNWLAHYVIHKADYEPSGWSKLWYIVSDTQYGYMLARLATFQFGTSALRTREPVSGLIWQAFLVSAPLMFMSELLIYLMAVPLGILCGVYRGGWTDRSISLGLFLLYSIPAFVAGMLFLVFFCYGDYLKWFPMLGLHSENAASLSFLGYLTDYLWHAFLPVVCLSLFSLAAVAMYSRSSILDVINQDYIRTARAKGLPEHQVILKHALRNGLIPILTLFSSFLPAMLGGSVLIEVLFGIPGLGLLGWSSILQKDFPTLMALLYVEAIVTLVSFLITDVLYVLVDPRISFAGRGKAA